MAKFRCVCGEVISTSGAIPNPNEWRILSDADFDGIAGSVEAEEVYRKSRCLYRCTNSGHLWVFWGGLDAPPHVYRPEPLPDTAP